MTRVVRVLIDSRDVVAPLAAAHALVPTGERVWLHAVIAPPVAQVRNVDLPRMTAGDARMAVARNPGRYFPDAREPQTVAVLRAPTGWLAAAAPTSVVESIHEAAQAIGWGVALVEPVHAHWARARGTGTFAVDAGGQTTILEATSGALVSVRRSPSGAPLPADLPHAVLVDPRTLNSYAVALPGSASTFDLQTASQAAARGGLVRRVAFAGLAATAVFVVIAAGATLWGERRELSALQAHRTELRQQVQQALARRDSLMFDSEQLGAIATLERGSERWSAVVARVAEALPRDASLTAFRAEADSVSLEGEARNAAGVFAAMRSAPGMTAVRASAPVRQEGGGQSGQPVVERFTLGARLRQPGGAP